MARVWLQVEKIRQYVCAALGSVIPLRIFITSEILMAVLWNVYGENENYGVFRGHKNAILDLQWSADSI
jgi:hypothetical protein